jgi:hypothetical protein
MTKEQRIHVGMVNSFNIITGKANIDQIIDAGIAVFAHEPNSDIGKKNIEFMIYYFREQEMYEECSELSKFVEETFNEDGTYRENFCECERPKIVEYTKRVKCGTCNMRIKV